MKTVTKSLKQVAVKVILTKVDNGIQLCDVSRKTPNSTQRLLF